MVGRTQSHESLRWDEHIQKGDSLQKSGDIQQTLYHYFGAYRLAEAIQDDQKLAISANKLGGMFSQFYRYAESTPYFKRAYQLSSNTEGLSKAHLANAIAWNYIKINEIDSALKYAEESVRLYQFEKSVDTMNYCIALESLGEIYSKRQKFKEADEVLTRCMNLGKASGNVIIQGFTHYGFALNFFNKQELTRAWSHIQSCLPVAEKYASPNLLADVYKLAFEIADGLKLRDQAYINLKRYSELKDKLHTEDIEKKAAIVNANFELQKKEDDLRISNQTNAIQTLRIEQQQFTQRITLASVGVFAIIAGLVYSRIRSKQKFDQRELERKKEEMEQARKVQLSLLPRKPLLDNGFEIVGKMITASEVGGDYFDFIKLDDHRVLIAFGDATGHGMAAGMMVTITKVTLINNLALLQNSNDVVPLARIINESILSSVSIKGIGMALQLCILDGAQKQLTITSCGMPFPFLLDRQNSYVTEIEIRQPPLGFLKNPKIELYTFQFQPHQILFLISDGILERFNRAKDEYGSRRTSNVIQTSCSASLNALLENIFADNETYSEGLPNHDDMTGLAARIL